MTGSVSIEFLDSSAEARWDDFVTSSSEATFFHRAGWKRVIEESFGHRCYYIYAQVGDEIRGVLPLAHIRSRIFGSALISNAFCVYGGPAAEDETTRRALDEAAAQLAGTLGVDYLEYRLRARSERDWPCEAELYATFSRDLDPDPENNLARIPRKQRAMIRKGAKVGLRSEEDGNVRRFFRVYSESVRNLGTPVLPRRYFSNLKSVFGDACEILTVSGDGGAIASVMSFYFRDEVLPYYGGGGNAARAQAGFDFMYWEVMRRACEKGCRRFDFGRSKRGTGAYAFKRHWGFEAQPLCYQYMLLRREDIPSKNPLDPRYRLAVNFWKRLPLPMANLIGPRLARSLA